MAVEQILVSLETHRRQISSSAKVVVDETGHFGIITGKQGGPLSNVSQIPPMAKLIASLGTAFSDRSRIFRVFFQCF